MLRTRSRAARVCARLVIAIGFDLGATELLAQEATPVGPGVSVPTPLVIVPPDYPSKALAEGRTAEVEVRGTISKTGILESARLSGGPRGEEFVDAVRDVLKWWRFIPGMDGDTCAAVPLDASVHVWFEIKEEKPAVFVSMPPTPPGANVVPDKIAEQTLVWKERPRVKFPPGALRRGTATEGFALVLVRIAMSGEIKEANVLVSSPLEEFGQEVVRALSDATYEAWDPKAREGKESVCAQLEVRFCEPDPPPNSGIALIARCRTANSRPRHRFGF